MNTKAKADKMEVLAPIIIDLIVERIKERCKDRNSKAAIQGMMAGTFGEEIPWRHVRRATRDATKATYGKRHWKANKVGLLASARAEMAKPSRQAEVMVGVFGEAA